jgi:hypothetical protein
VRYGEKCPDVGKFQEKNVRIGDGGDVLYGSGLLQRSTGDPSASVKVYPP